MEVRSWELLRELSAKIPTVRIPVASLSGGQRQTVAIARSLLGDPKIIILDEPTAALGVAQTAEVLNLIERLRERGLGVIMISHNMADVKAVADTVAVLRLGRNNGVFDVATSPGGDHRRHHRRQRQRRRPARRRAAAAQPRRPPRSACRDDVDTDPDRRARRDGPAGRAPARRPGAAAARSALRDRVRGGDLGVLPVVAGLIVIAVVFSSLNPIFLSSTNLVEPAAGVRPGRRHRARHRLRPARRRRSTCRSARSAGCRPR